MGLSRIFWTGGWDSTFRVMSLLIEHGQEVQPYYVIDEIRRSFPYELRAMMRVKEALRTGWPEAAGRLRPTVIADKTDIRPDPEVTDAWRRMRQRTIVGTQDDWLVRFARQWGIAPVEVAMHKDSELQKFVMPQAELVALDGVKVWALRRELTDPDIEFLRPFVFPLLDILKVELGEEARRLGFSHVLEMTWFCHRPQRDGTPCGECGPCEVAQKQGMGRRVPPPSLRRRLHKRVSALLPESVKVRLRHWIYG